MKRNNLLLLLSIVILSACQNASFLTKKYDAKGKWSFKASSNAEQVKANTTITDQAVCSLNDEELILVKEEVLRINPDTDIIDSEEVISEEYVPMPDPYMDSTMVEEEGAYALPYDTPKSNKKGMKALLKATSFFIEIGIGILCVLGIIALIAAISLGSVTGVMLVLAILGIIALFAIGLVAAIMALFTIAMLMFLILMKFGGPGKIGG
jgi:hypothetical protein